MALWQEWLRKRDPFILIGLPGVSPHEGRRACGWGLFFTYGKVLVAIGLLWQWQLAMLHEFSEWNRWLLNCGIWFFFLLELFTLSSFVSNRRRYLRQNWMLTLIVLLGIPFVIRNDYGIALLTGAKPFLAILLLMPSIRVLARFFADGQLSTTLLAATIIVIVFGVLVAGVDPGIQSAWDGIWWAIATVSTVGYGDIVPSSLVGRLVGIGLIVMGLGIFVVITANFLALVLKRETQELKREELEIDLILREVKSISVTQEQLLQELEKLNQRIESLEESARK